MHTATPTSTMHPGIPLRRALLAAGAITALASLSPSAEATTLLSQDFTSFTGSTTYTADTTVGSGTGTMYLTIQSPQSTTVSSSGLAFTDNSSASTALNLARAPFSGVTTGGTGNNKIQGYFDFTSLNATGTASTNPDMTFAVNTGTTTLFTSAAASAVQIIFLDGNKVTYRDASGQSPVLYTLDYGTAYRFSLAGDFSSTTQDTYTFSLTNLSTGLVVYTSGTINTRAANVTPESFLWTAGNDQTAASANAFWQLSNAQFTAVPEPSTTMTLLLGAAGLLVLRFRRRVRDSLRVS